MSVVETPTQDLLSRKREVASELAYITWAHWPINWSAIWVGALASIAVLFIFGLIAIAVGAQLLGAEHRIADFKKLGIGALAFSIFGSFLAFAAGGWITGKIAGIHRSEPAILYAAISWCVAVPVLMALAAVGAGASIGGWFGGLTTVSNQTLPFEKFDPLPPDATAAEKSQRALEEADLKQRMRQWKDETPSAVRNSALGAITALLLGLVGSVIGGWLASGEPMNFRHHRTRKTVM
jgi:hypothetical protein